MAHLINMDDLGYRTFTNPWITIVGAEPIVWLFGGQVGLTIAGKKKEWWSDNYVSQVYWIINLIYLESEFQ